MISEVVTLSHWPRTRSLLHIALLRDSGLGVHVNV